MRIHRLAVVSWLHSVNTINASFIRTRDGLMLADILEVKKTEQKFRNISPKDFFFFFFDPCLLIFFPFVSKKIF